MLRTTSGNTSLKKVFSPPDKRISFGGYSVIRGILLLSDNMLNKESNPCLKSDYSYIPRVNFGRPPP